MGLSIKTNVASLTAQRNLGVAVKETNRGLEQLSSGKRINHPSDDPAGLAISTNLEAQTRGLRQAERNANESISLVQTAEGGASEVSNILVRLRELSVQGASDTVNDDERALLNNEYTGLLEEIDRISNSTTYNGTKIMNGDSGKGVMTFQVGAFGTEENRINFDADSTNMTTSSLGISGSEIESRDSSGDNLEGIDTALSKVNGMRANLGAVQSRLQFTVSNLETQTINQDNARSVIQDADIAKASASFAVGNIMKEAGVAMLAQANTMPATALRLIS
jgi:flagellin